VPSLSDKLAQRNLTIVGAASPHLIPQPFDIKPTAAFLPSGKMPDELLIDWSNLPSGSQASIYLPGTNVLTILGMADKLYSHHGLSHSDAHTVTCDAQGITYVPIPPGIGSNFAGLLTVELPPTVRRGEAFKIITRQITNAFARRLEQPPPPTASSIAIRPARSPFRTSSHGAASSVPSRSASQCRRNRSSLAPEERLLSVLRWIAKGIPYHNRWYSVFHRYLEQIAARVTALGGDPNTIVASSSGDGNPKRPPHKQPDDRLCFTGKIAGLIFDHFGNFEGFVLATHEGEHKFFSCENEVKELAEHAWHERFRLTVCPDHHEPHRPLSFMVHEPPSSFEF
jgi:hypothetical protein